VAKKCAVPICGKTIEDWALCCLSHWRRISKEGRKRVNTTLRAYKANPTIDTANAYRDAVAAAVAELTGQPALGF
jgi:hypothetical protein